MADETHNEQATRNINDICKVNFPNKLALNLDSYSYLVTNLEYYRDPTNDCCRKTSAEVVPI